MLAGGSQDPCKHGVGLGVPSCPFDRYLSLRMPYVGQPCHHRVKPERTGRGALGGPVRPLPLWFEAPMGPALLEGRCHEPAFWQQQEALDPVGSFDYSQADVSPGP
jgi:hypothetical protein